MTMSHIFKDMGCISMVFWVMSKLDPMYDLWIKIGYRDLYFMGQ